MEGEETLVGDFEAEGFGKGDGLSKTVTFVMFTDPLLNPSYAEARMIGIERVARARRPSWTLFFRSDARTTFRARLVQVRFVGPMSFARRSWLVKKGY